MPFVSEDFDITAAVGFPFVIVGALVGVITILARWGLAAAVGFWVLFVFGLMAWSLGQLRRARREIRRAIERCGCKVMKMNYRYFRLGPFSMWNSSRSQLVYRVVAREATGRERIVWAQWGRRWFWNRDTLEVKWEDETSPR